MSNTEPYIEITAFPSEEGDSLLLSFAETEDNSSKRTHILVDAGFKEEVFEHEIKPILRKIKVRGEKIDLFVITHIDADHIRGAITLLTQNGKADSPQIVEIGEIWHNSYKHIYHSNEESSQILAAKQIDIIERITKLAKHQLLTPTGEEEEISASEDGLTVAKCIEEYGYTWNSATGGKAICVENFKTSYKIGEDVNIVLLGPDDALLKKLEKEWKKQMKKDGYAGHPFTSDEIFEGAFEALMQIPEPAPKIEENVSKTAIEKRIDAAKLVKSRKDSSPKNGSSISFYVEFLEKKLLLLGDCFDETIIKYLKGVIEETDGTILFDAIKVSHHGSKSNNRTEFWEKFDAGKFIFSTNGKTYKHPHLETLVRIFNRVLPNNIPKRKLYFNYPLDIVDELNDEKLKAEYNYDIKVDHQIKV